MARFKFYLKDPASKKTTSIILVCQWSNQQVKLYTGKTVLPEMWNAADGKARQLQDFPEGRKLNARLAGIEQDASNTFWDLELKLKRPPTKDEFKRSLMQLLRPLKHQNQDREKTTYDLYEFTERECRVIEATKMSQGKTAKEAERGTGDYTTTVASIRQFWGHGKPLYFEDITRDFYAEFLKFCISVKKYKPNTIGSRIKTIKSIMRRALKQGLHNNLAFEKFSRPMELVDKVYLSPEELKKIQSVELTAKEKKRYDKSRDLFIVACWTGLRFGDWKQLLNKDMRKDYITITTQKTGQTVVLPLLPAVKEIVKRYKGKLPRISSTQINLDIKEIARRAGIKEMVGFKETRGGATTHRKEPKYNLISAHTARRSFATNLYNLDIPILDIMKLTGHKTQAAFMRYIRITESESASKIMNMLSGNETLWSGKTETASEEQAIKSDKKEVA